MGNSMLLRAYEKCCYEGCRYKRIGLSDMLPSCLALKITIFLILACLQTSLTAQETAESKAAASENIEMKVGEDAQLDINLAADRNVIAKDAVLRLEETIRGNKEQPKVLSIVPWQLPLYQRIDRNEQLWKPINTRLKPVERRSFLKEIQLIEDLQAGHSGAQVDSKSN